MEHVEILKSITMDTQGKEEFPNGSNVLSKLKQGKYYSYSVTNRDKRRTRLGIIYFDGDDDKKIDLPEYKEFIESKDVFIKMDSIQIVTIRKNNKYEETGLLVSFPYLYDERWMKFPTGLYPIHYIKGNDGLVNIVEIVYKY